MIHSNYYDFVQLEQWYQTPLGLACAHAEKERFMHHLSVMRGLDLIQLGIGEQQHWLAASPIFQKYVVNFSLGQQKGALFAHEDALPIANESVNVVVLPHTLEFIQTPMALLTEVERILSPNGFLLISGFNPLSLWGFRHLLKLGNGSAPWNGKFLGLVKLRHLLVDYGFEIQSVESFFYRPPVNSAYWLKKTYFLELMNRFVSFYPGGLYLIVAQKKVIPLTPIKPIWQLGEYIIGKHRHGVPVG